MSDEITQPILSVLVTNSLVLSVNVLLLTFVKSLLVPKYHFKLSPLFVLVTASFNESPEQKEYLEVLKTGLTK